MSSLATAVPSQEGLSEYLQHGGYDRHLRQLRQTLQINQAAVLRAIDRHFPPGTRATRPEGGYFVWIELSAAVDALKLQRLALSHEISLAPGHLFSADRRHEHFLRINYGHPDDRRMESAIRTVGKIASSMASTPAPS